MSGGSTMEIRPRRNTPRNISLSAKPDEAVRHVKVALLTGGADKPYALGLAATLVSHGIYLDFIGSDQIGSPDLQNTPLVNSLNLRGDQRTDVSRWMKAVRVLRYYARLLCYAGRAKPTVFHILWNNRLELFDRTVLMLYYKALAKKIIFTAHNVNAGKRDGNDSCLNRMTLRIQYHLADHIFVHTAKMRDELASDFGVSTSAVSVIPFGVNNTVPNTALTTLDAKRRLGLDDQHKAVLFFGHIAPYKGLEDLVAGMAQLARSDSKYRLIIAGRPKGCDEYWARVQGMIASSGLKDQIIQRITYIPDDCVEQYFKAADVLVLPYTHIFQSGVLFLGYSFGLPVIATDVGSLKEDIIEGKTGFVCRAQDPRDLARAIETYFSSDLFQHLHEQRGKIQAYANERYSWDTVGEVTKRVYLQLLKR